jgi:hypothetical protein
VFGACRAAMDALHLSTLTGGSRKEPRASFSVGALVSFNLARCRFSSKTAGVTNRS